MSKWIKTLIVLAVVLILGAILFASLRGKGRVKGTEVYATEVTRKPISLEVKATGTIDPRVKVNISTEVIARIEKLFVEEGDTVEAGQPFLELDQDTFRAARDSWTAQLRRAQTSVRQAQVSQADTKIKLERTRRLIEQGIISTEQMETAELQYTSAGLQVEQARQDVEQAQANLAKAEEDLKKTRIFAPLSGRVITLNAEAGEVVVSGTMNNPASVIGTIADLSELLAEVDIDETDIVHVAIGQPVVLAVDAVDDKTYSGRVVEVGSSGYNRAGQGDVTFFKVKILLDEPDESLRPGMSVRSTITAAVHQEAFVVPVQAVVQRELENAEAGDDAKEASVVFVVDGTSVVQREVEVGLSTTTEAEIINGLEVGEQVVTGPYRSLRDLKQGDAVVIKDEKTSDKEDA